MVQSWGEALNRGMGAASGVNPWGLLGGLFGRPWHCSPTILRGVVGLVRLYQFVVRRLWVPPSTSRSSAPPLPHSLPLCAVCSSV